MAIPEGLAKRKGECSETCLREATLTEQGNRTQQSTEMVKLSSSEVLISSQVAVSDPFGGRHPAQGVGRTK